MKDTGIAYFPQSGEERMLVEIEPVLFVPCRLYKVDYDRKIAENTDEANAACPQAALSLEPDISMSSCDT